LLPLLERAMRISLLSRVLRAAALACLGMILAGGVARAACYGPAQRLSPEALAQFNADPARLLSQYPDGGALMISMVRDLVASDPATLPVILDLSVKGNSDQIKSIGTGLGQAALVCSRTDPSFANEIQQMVAASNNNTLTIAFTDVMGDQQLAASDPGIGAGGGGSGPAENNGIFGGFFAGGPLNFPVGLRNVPTNFFTSNFNTPGNTAVPTFNTNVITDSVSPSQ
jgi:hypothetical protein